MRGLNLAILLTFGVWWFADFDWLVFLGVRVLEGVVVVILVNLSTLGESFLFGEFWWISLLCFFGFV